MFRSRTYIFFGFQSIFGIIRIQVLLYLPRFRLGKENKTHLVSDKDEKDKKQSREIAVNMFKGYICSNIHLVSRSAHTNNQNEYRNFTTNFLFIYLFSFYIRKGVFNFSNINSCIGILWCILISIETITL
jgi:hypothetical protein